LVEIKIEVQIRLVVLIYPMTTVFHQ